MTLNFTDGGFFRNGRKAEAQERLGVAVDVFACMRACGGVETRWWSWRLWCSSLLVRRQSPIRVL